MSASWPPLGMNDNKFLSVPNKPSPWLSFYSHSERKYTCKGIFLKNMLSIFALELRDFTVNGFFQAEERTCKVQLSIQSAFSVSFLPSSVSTGLSTMYFSPRQPTFLAVELYAHCSPFLSFNLSVSMYSCAFNRLVEITVAASEVSLSS